jgi:hypothetical protein
MKLRASLPSINHIQLLLHFLIYEILFAHWSRHLLIIVTAAILINLVAQCIEVLNRCMIGFLRRLCTHF